MDLPDDSPRLPKIPFIIGDLILLSVAALLAYRMGTDPTTAEVVGVVVTTGLAVAAGLAPFVISYARDQDQMLRDRERMLEGLVRSTATAADQASIAANGLNEIAEKTKANLATLDSLPATIQAARKAAEAASVKSAGKREPDLAPLKDELTALRDDLAAKTAELNARIDAAVVAMENSTQTMARAAIVETPKISTPPDPAKPPTRRRKAKAAPPPPVEDSLFGGEIGEDDLPDVEANLPDPGPVKTTKKRKTRKKEPAPENKTEMPAAAEDAPKEGKSDVDPAPADEKPMVEAAPPAPASPTETTIEDLASTPANEPVPPDEAGEEPASTIEAAGQTETSEPPPTKEATPAPDEAVESPVAEEQAPELISGDDDPVEDVLDEPAPEEPALSSDGLTRITVTAYIGIGNRLFIRGDGPGLSRDEGVPLQFVSIGKWRWETDGATEPIKVTLWKNDEEECTAAGEIELRPGAQLETSANF